MTTLADLRAVQDELYAAEASLLAGQDHRYQAKLQSVLLSVQELLRESTQKASPPKRRHA